jgi:hypothetical protein
VPRALDAAVRRCLERDPSLRYESALDMAAALEGGLHGEEPGTAQWDTGSTQMLAGEDATQALPRTSALPRHETWAPPTGPPPGEVPARRERPPKKRDSAARARLFALALILVLAAVAIALLVSQSNDNYQNIDEGNSHDQAVELINYVREHRE